MNITNTKFDNCCPSCTAMMAIRVGRLTQNRAEALDCSSAAVDPFVGQQLLMCWHCGYVAPKGAWDSCDENDDWRLIFSSAISARSAVQVKQIRSQEMRAKGEQLIREANALEQD
jgi:hypothetical protein